MAHGSYIGTEKGTAAQGIVPRGEHGVPSAGGDVEKRDPHCRWMGEMRWRSDHAVFLNTFNTDLVVSSF